VTAKGAVTANGVAIETDAAPETCEAIEMDARDRTDRTSRFDSGDLLAGTQAPQREIEFFTRDA